MQTPASQRLALLRASTCSIVLLLCFGCGGGEVEGDGADGAAASHTGVVVDLSGAPVEGVEVRWWEDRVRTDARGRFRLPFAVYVPSSIRAFHPDHGVGETVEAFNFRPTEPVRIVLERPTRIRGRVVGSDGAAIREGFIGYAFYREGTIWSDAARLAADGRVESDPFFTRFRRRVRVRFYSQSHDRVEATVVLEPGRDADFGVLTAPPLPKAARLSGRVEGPLGMFSVITPGARVEKDGSFSTEWDLLPGPLRPEWNAFGAQGEVLVAVGPPISLAAGEHRTGYVIAVQPPASLEGVVVDHEGTPQPLATVVVSMRRSFLRSALRKQRRGGHVQSDRAGRFRIDRLVAGPYFVAVPRPGFLERDSFDVDALMAPLTVELAPGANRVELRLPDPGVVRGWVHPVPGLRATLDGERPLAIDAEGRFAFRREGVNHVVLQADGWMPLLLLVPSERYVHWPGLLLQRGNSVEGIVEGAKGAEIRLRRELLPDMVARPGADGRFAFDNVPFGAIEFEATAPGHPPQVIPYDAQHPRFIRVRFGPTPAPPPSDPR